MKGNVMLQIQTKISFWVQNKPRVIIWTEMKDFHVKTCEKDVFFLNKIWQILLKEKKTHK